MTDLVQHHSTFCAVCSHSCAVQVETRNGRVTSVTGDDDNPLYRGYSCVKGRGHAALYEHPDRLTRSVKRSPGGDFLSIPSDTAMDEIAEQLRAIIERHGPRSLAIYFGTYFAYDHPVHITFLDAFATAIGTPMLFSPFTTDQPGKWLARGLHGVWMAPAQYREPDAVLLVGHNPLISHQHRAGNPGDFFRDLEQRGAELIVIDPRRTETARRATLFLQPRPGHDAAIVACLIRQVIEDGRQDREFLADEVDGFDDLVAAVAPFDPASVAERAGVPAADLVAAARILGGTRRAYVAAGTGPNMTGEGTLIEYLLLCLDTVCGHWMRAGDHVSNALTVFPQSLQLAKAQAIPPFPSFGYGEKMRVRGLTQTNAGMPTAALADEILLPGEGQVKAMICLGGNPLNSVPDQPKMQRALDALELLVCTDIQMSPTAKFADYVIAPKLPFELPSTTFILEVLTMMATGLGVTDSYAQYSPAIVEPPAGSDVIAQWELLYGLAQRLGLKLTLHPGAGGALAGDELDEAAGTLLDMARKPADEDLLEIVHAGSRIPLEEIKRHPHGAFFPEPAVVVQPKDPGYPGRLQVGAKAMLADLAAVAERDCDVDSAGYPFRLISRRMMHVLNTPTIVAPRNRKPYNPAFMHPSDLAALALQSGDLVEICSAYSTITGVVEPDDSVREGTISMSHSFGNTPEFDDDVRSIGSCTGRLVSSETFYDRYSGQPRMSNVPVRVTRADRVSASAVARNTT